MNHTAKIFLWPKRTELTVLEAADIADLREQLREQKHPPTPNELNRSLQHSELVVATCNNCAAETARIIGMAWLVPVYVAGNFRGRIEDVVIDEEHRGQKIGVYMLGILLQRAREMRMQQIDLTSSKKRTAARGLYARFGFATKDTDTWQLKF